MAPEKRDKKVVAVEAVHAALKGLNAQERQRVLASIYALLEMSPSVAPTKEPEAAEGVPVSPTISGPPTSARPVAIRELIQDKKPRTHPQFITLFAYFRERHEGRATFSRADLARYYAASRENPPANYDRDFVEAVKKGWIHEDADKSYITSKGIEAIESGFAGTAEKRARQGHTKERIATKKRTSKKRA